MSKPYRVLIIAGGGVFGIIPASLLARRFKDKSLLDDFDCFAGTSIGGILAMCYASGMAADEVADAMRTTVNKAFPKMPWWWRWNPLMTKYSPKGLEEALHMILPMTLGELKAPVVIPTVDFKNTRPKVFDTLVKDEDHQMPAWEVGRATSSAPTYFPPFKSFIDGGLIANMPILETVAAISDKAGVPYDEMEIMVLGTGNMPHEPRDMDKIRGWTRIQWIMPLLNFMVRANELRSSFIAHQLAFRKLKIFNPVIIEKDWELDRVDLVPIVELMSQNYDKVFDRLCTEFLD